MIDNPSTLVDCMYQLFVEYQVDVFTSTWKPHDVEPLVDIVKETKGNSIDPLCNRHLYYVTQVPLRRKSQLYVFGRKEDWKTDIREGKVMDTQDETPKTCAIFIEDPHICERKVLKTILNLD